MQYCLYLWRDTSFYDSDVAFVLCCVHVEGLVLYYIVKWNSLPQTKDNLLMLQL